MFVKREERMAARELREVGGHSLAYIAAVLGVAKSSVSRWTRDIELTPAQHEALHPTFARANGSSARRRVALEERVRYQDAGRRLAATGDARHEAGCMLYWGEGSKHRNRVVVTNSDADLLAFFLRFLRECYGVDDERVAFSVNCFLGNGLELEEIEAWWLERLQLPATCLRKAQVNRISRASSRKRPPLVYGTGRVCVHSTEIVQSILGAIQEYAGIERPKWLG